MSPNPFYNDKHMHGFFLLDTHVKLTKNTLQALQYGNMQFEKKCKSVLF